MLVYVCVFTIFFLHSLAENFMENRRDGEKNMREKYKERLFSVRFVRFYRIGLQSPCDSFGQLITFT